MTIWILALVLFASLAAIGYNQGAIRVGFSLIGLVISAWLAGPLCKVTTPMVKGLLGMFNVVNPVLIWALAPLAAFLIVLTLFKVAGFATHRQVEVFYKYKAGELRLALWERMNKRVGACLGIINGLVYLLLISLVIYVISYCTTQMAINEDGPKMVRFVNRAGHDVVATGLDKAVRTIDPVPPSYYEASDIVGMIYHNPLTQGRLSRYPTFLSLAERPEFQALTADTAFLEMLDRQASVAEILSNEKTKAILNNPALLNDIWGQVAADLHDLHEYLLTGISAKYSSEPILGRWTFNLPASIKALKQVNPNISTSQIQRMRKYLVYAYGKAVFVAMPDHHAIMKDVVLVQPPQIVKPEMLNDLQKLSGQWANTDGKYSVSLENTKDLTATTDNGKIKMTGAWSPIVFSQD